MADLLSVPLKKPSEVEIIKPLKNLIQSTYSTADKPEDYSEAISELSKLRNTAIWRAFEKYESSLEILYSYYDQLFALEGKIPPHEVQIPFKWKDAFDKGSIFGSRISLTISSLAYERICVLFNIAALQSAVASSQNFDNDDGLKLAAKLFQQSAGIFLHLRNTAMMFIRQDPTPDLNPDTLAALSSLMLAQAQEVFVYKAIHDNIKHQVVAKLSAQCDDLYAECMRSFQKDTLRPLWDKDWIPIITGKQAGHAAMAFFYQSLVCKADKSIGEEIARLEHCLELFKECHQRSGRPTMFQHTFNNAQRNLAEARKDNDFIYHERIPDVKRLEPIGRAALAKPTPVSNPMSQNFRDLFNELVPVAVHQALAAYDVRKNEIVNTEIMKLRESTQVLNSVLASLNLPAAIESTEGSNLPQSLLDKADTIKQLGGIRDLERLISELPELLSRNTDILNEAVRMLDEEKKADDTLREQFKEKWSRTPSEKLTELFRSNADKYRKIIDNAVNADKTVREKFESHRAGMELLSKSNSEIQNAVPRGSGAGVTDCSAVQTLRKLMEEVETMKAERDVIESELKSATVDMKSNFLGALVKDGAISEPQMSVESLGHAYGPLQKQVKESIERQEKLIADIQGANTEFMQANGASAGGRDAMMRQLACAHDAFRELQNNLQEGTKFYNDLTQLLITFQNKISDYCFARKTEKEELMKDLTQESSRQEPAVTPTLPTHYTPADPKREMPPRPTPPQPQPQPQAAGSSAPQQMPSNLPYPVYVQGMPVPYGATANAPYPTYVPPPMPQGYNPYGTMPYPPTYNYPGYPQQVGYHPDWQTGFPNQGQQPGAYPQQGQPPGAYPQQGQQGGYRPPNPQSGYPHQQTPPGW